MGRPAKPKVEKAPLIIHEASEPFYKAFMFPEKDVDMIVDTSGDVFSHTIEGAIRSMFKNMERSKIMSIPMKLFETMDGVALNTDTSKDNPNMKDIVIVKIYCHWDQELIDNMTDDDGEDFIMTLKGVTDGYTTALAEYNIDEIKFTTSDAVINLKSLVATLNDPERTSPSFPKEIKI